MKPHIFREYDVRGLVDRDLNEEVAEQLGLGIGTLVRRAGGRAMVLGRDCRASSTRYRDALAKGAMATGIDLYDIGVVPTPLTYFAAHTLPVDGLAMITGSHNPPEYNGFKLGVGKRTLFGEEIQGLRRLIEAGDFERGRGELRPWELIESYGRFVAQEVTLARPGMKVVVDAGNGVGGHVAVPLLRSLGVEVVPLYCDMDANFPNHHPDPTVVENMLDLVAAVRRENAALGIAYDGDADRIGVVDDRGQILWGDDLTVLFAREVLKARPGATIIGEVKCSMRLYDDIRAKGGVPIMWKAGHSLIKAKMKECGAALAGEMSGHIFWSHRYFGFDDAIYSTARLLEILCQGKETLSERLADLPVTFATPELRVETEEEKKMELVRRATEHFRRGGHSICDVDGVRVSFPDGWGLIRASNTQPILVTRFEATSKERLAEIQGMMEGELAQLQRDLG